MIKGVCWNSMKKMEPTPRIEHQEIIPKLQRAKIKIKTKKMYKHQKV